jgi:cell division septum initiation protein DivIVA
MTNPTNQFRVVLRGYDPAQVDRRIQELTETAENAIHKVGELSGRVRRIEEERANEPEADEVPPAVAFSHLGERVGRILTLADEEAADLRGRAQSEVEAFHEQAHQANARLRDEADRYAEQRRSDADTEAARTLEDARRTADERLDTADRDAAARLQEAEAVYENQRAKAAQAATDFETTLAKRRESAEADFTEQMGSSKLQLEQAEGRVEQLNAEAEQVLGDAGHGARRLIDEAKQKAETSIREAKTVAARVRSDSERELAAATQRRDSINAQLANVRQMLATLSGVAPAALVGLDDVSEETTPDDPEPTVLDKDAEPAKDTKSKQAS